MMKAKKSTAVKAGPKPTAGTAIKSATSKHQTMMTNQKQAGKNKGKK